MRSAERAKLAAIYCVYDGEELLEGSVATIRRCASLVIAIVQTRSNVGELYEGGLAECRRLRREGLIDVLCVVEPDLQQPPALNETANRQLGVTLAKHLHASHFCFVDCDEFYEPCSFATAWDMTVNRGWEATACQLQTYFRYTDWQLSGIEDFWVPWVHRVRPDTTCGFSGYPLKVDPTRATTCSLTTLLPLELIRMHHFSFVRENLRRKLSNNTCLFPPWQIEAYIQDHAYASPGQTLSSLKRTITSVTLPDFGVRATRVLEAFKSPNCGAAIAETLTQPSPQHLRDPAAGFDSPLDASHILQLPAKNFAASIPARSAQISELDLGEALNQCRSPLLLLKQARSQMRERGQCTATVANVRQGRSIESLLRGCTSPGSFIDQPCCTRLYTLRELEKLFFRGGFDFKDVVFGMPQITPESPHDCDWNSPTLSIRDVDEHEGTELAAERISLRTTATRRARYGLTSIIIVTYNQWPFTEQCLESIRFSTDEPYEIIVVDNGSTDGTVDMLRRCSDVSVIENSENRGFPAAVNQGMKAAVGDQILLLNNDTLVTTGWLRRMLDALGSNDRVGLVGPCSNCVCSEQQIAVTYMDLMALDGFAWSHGQRNKSRIREVSRLVGFCLLFPRQLLAVIGELDERFGVGNFEDDDLCHRAQLAGYRIIIAEDAFVHHFGHRSFLGNGIDLRTVLSKNQQLYFEKWPALRSRSATSGHFESSERLSPMRSASEHCLPSDAAPRPQLSLCMIVRDNEATIRPCLESVSPWVDEMIIVDTGSVDRTPEIALEYGAKVFHFPWCDDFSAARNESLRHASGEWIFWMDSDDTLPADNGRQLRSHLNLRADDDDTLGYVMQVHCPATAEDGTVDVTIVDHIKLFRNREELRFEGRIHEQILPAIRRAGGDVEWTDLFVVHSGADYSRLGRRRKYERDLKLLHLDLADHPDHSFVLFNIGMTYADMDAYDLAADYLQRALESSSVGESHLRKVYALLVGALTHLDDLARAQGVCQQGLVEFPDDPELLFRQAILAHRLGQLADAEASYLKVLQNPSGRHFSSIDQGITGYKARHNLAIVYIDMGRPELAEAQWRICLTDAPDFQEARQGLQQVLHQQGRTDAMLRTGWR